MAIKNYIIYILYISLYLLQDIGGRAFYWADDTIVDYVNWAPGEPNNYLNTEGTIIMTCVQYSPTSEILCIWFLTTAAKPVT